MAWRVSLGRELHSCLRYIHLPKQSPKGHVNISRTSGPTPSIGPQSLNSAATHGAPTRARAIANELINPVVPRTTNSDARARNWQQAVVHAGLVVSPLAGLLALYNLYKSIASANESNRRQVLDGGELTTPLLTERQPSSSDSHGSFSSDDERA